jgi:hypothetical protein
MLTCVPTAPVGGRNVTGVTEVFRSSHPPAPLGHADPVFQLSQVVVARLIAERPNCRMLTSPDCPDELRLALVKVRMALETCGRKSPTLALPRILEMEGSTRCMTRGFDAEKFVVGSDETI